MLAERPHLVKRLFIQKDRNDKSIYGVWLNIDGFWKCVIVDDYFPCYNDKSGPCFSRTQENEIWVLILEKAYAKVFGSYLCIESGHSSESMQDLTGAPYEYFEDKDNVEETWGKLSKYV